MKKILYDNQVFDLQTLGGISKQFVNLSKNLTRYDSEIAVENTNNLYLKEYKKLQDSNVHNFNYALRKVAEQNYDIFHPTYFYTYFLEYIGNKPFVLTIHDMIIERFSDDLSKLEGDSKLQVEGKRILSEKASKIITVSEYSKKDIIEFLNVPKDKVVVCYNGADERFGTHNDTDIINDINYEYILYVGTRAGTKNFDMLYNEFIKIHKKYPDLHLVLVGPKYSQDEYMKICEDELNKFICLYINISEDSLETLYRHAKCFIFPSIYEGFGIPIVEAFMCKCPILLNNTSCFPEIGQDAALYFNLTNEKNNFMEIFDQFMNYDEKQINQMVNKGLEYSKKYTWQNFTKSVENVYDEVLKNKKS